MSYSSENRTAMSGQAIVLLLVMLLLSLFGLCYIYSTGYIGDDYPVRENWQRQLVYMLLGLLVFRILAGWPNQNISWRFFVFSGYFLSLLGLVLVLLFGRQVGGARRWLVVGSFFLQPAEFAKVFTLLAICLVLTTDRIKSGWLQLLAAIMLLIPPVLLIKMEPSLGNAISLLPPFLALVLVKHCPVRLCLTLTMLALILFAAAVIGLFYLRSLPVQPEILRQAETAKSDSLFFRSYHLRRLQSYLSGQGGWNERQSLMAVASGGWQGKGFLNGTQKSLGYLPRTVAPTDFIFSVIAEEGGFLWGSLPIVLLYMLLLGLCLHWGATAANELDCLLCVAFSTLSMVHIMVGLGMTVRVLPIIGLPLPLLSYGGSFTLCVFAMLGVMAATRMNVGSGTHSRPQPEISFSWGRLLRFQLRPAGLTRTGKTAGGTPD
jgi:rod shape determining protein RodA